MNKETLEHLTDQMHKTLSPVRGMNQLCLQSFDRMMEFQLRNLNDYTRIAMDHIKAATEITDQKAFDAFIVRQGEAFTAVMERLLADSRALTSFGLDLSQEARELTQQQITTVNTAHGEEKKETGPRKAA